MGLLTTQVIAFVYFGDKVGLWVLFDESKEGVLGDRGGCDGIDWSHRFYSLKILLAVIE